MLPIGRDGPLTWLPQVLAVAPVEARNDPVSLLSKPACTKPRKLPPPPEMAPTVHHNPRFHPSEPPSRHIPCETSTFLASETSSAWSWRPFHSERSQGNHHMLPSRFSVCQRPSNNLARSHTSRGVTRISPRGQVHHQTLTQASSNPPSNLAAGLCLLQLL